MAIAPTSLFDQCPHRMGCANCSFYQPKDSSAAFLFLDEIGELPRELQAKLLRVIQEKEVRSVGSTDAKPVNARFIAATHRDLKHAVEDGTFRSDLYFRLNVFPIQMPPLRERKEDIPLLVTAFLTKHADSMRPIETVCQDFWSIGDGTQLAGKRA